MGWVAPGVMGKLDGIRRTRCVGGDGEMKVPGVCGVTVTGGLIVEEKDRGPYWKTGWIVVPGAWWGGRVCVSVCGAVV